MSGGEEMEMQDSSLIFHYAHATTTINTNIHEHGQHRNACRRRHHRHLQLLASNRRFCSSVCCMIWDKCHINCGASTACAGGNKMLLRKQHVQCSVSSVSLRINTCHSPYSLLCRRRKQETGCKSTSADFGIRGARGGGHASRTVSW